MPAGPMPAAEVDVTEALVRRLLTEQHPDLAERPLELVAFGWDNVVYRLGDDLVVRLPRRQMGVPLIEHEQRWLPELARHLPLPVPAPVRVGHAADGYPWPWSICPWLPGAIAAEQPPADQADAASALGAFVAALHRPAPADAPSNPVRGIPLAERAELTERFLHALEGTIDTAAARRRWAEALEVPPWPGPLLWLHGDLHPANLLVADGHLSAVIDFGDMCGGDPATDLAVAWMLFDADHRPAFRAAAGDVDDDTWRRAEGWALAIGAACLSNSADHPVVAAIGRRTLTALHLL